MFRLIECVVFIELSDNNLTGQHKGNVIGKIKSLLVHSNDMTKNKLRNVRIG